MGKRTTVKSEIRVYRGFCFPPEVIAHAVFLYHRFPLSLRDVEDLLAQRGIAVSYETIRRWCRRFGPHYARNVRRLVGVILVGLLFVARGGLHGGAAPVVDEAVAARSVLTCTPMSSASTGNGRSAWSSRCVASALARAMTWGGVARRPASHVRYDSGDTSSMAAHAACDWPIAIRHSRSVRGSTTSHHAIGARRREARGWRWAYFSQPIFEADRSLCSLHIRRGSRESERNRRIL